MMRPWFTEADPSQAASAAWAHAMALKAYYTKRANRDRLNQLIYLNRSLTTAGPYRQAIELLGAAGFTAARLNITKSKLKTLQNKVAKYPSALRVNPDGSKYELKEKAQLLDQFLSGMVKRSDTQLLNQTLFRDGGMVATGCLKAVVDEGRPTLERVRRRELLVDGREGRDGKPWQIHHLTRVSRTALLSQFKGDEVATRRILEAKPAPTNLDDSQSIDGMMTVETDLVLICESHKRASCSGAGDGKRLLHLETGPLSYGEWKYPRLPYAFFLWEQRIDDFWSPESFVDEMKPIQWKLNEAVADLQAALFYGGNPVLLTRKGSGVSTSNFGKRRDLPRVEWDGNAPPQIVAFNPVSQQKVDFIAFLLRQADEISGVSLMAQAAKNPLGANASGRALEEFDDRESERHWDLDFNLSLMWRDAGDILVDAAKDAAEEQAEAGYKASWAEGTFLRRVPWADMDMDRDQFEIQLEAGNFFPETRSGKLAASERLMQGGVIKGPDIPGLMDYPDLRDTMAELTASKDAINKWLSHCSKGETVAIDPTLDLDRAESMAINRYRRAYAEEAGAERLGNYRRAIQLVQAAIKKREDGKAQALPPAGAPPMPGGPTPTGLDVGALPPGPAPAALPGQALPGLAGI